MLPNYKLGRTTYFYKAICLQTKRGGSLNECSLLYKALNFKHSVYMLFLYKQRLETWCKLIHLKSTLKPPNWRIYVSVSFFRSLWKFARFFFSEHDPTRPWHLYQFPAQLKIRFAQTIFVYKISKCPSQNRCLKMIMYSVLLPRSIFNSCMAGHVRLILCYERGRGAINLHRHHINL